MVLLRISRLVGLGVIEVIEVNRMKGSYWFMVVFVE